MWHEREGRRHGQPMVNAQLLHGTGCTLIPSHLMRTAHGQTMSCASARKGEHVSRLARRRCSLGVQDAAYVFQIHAPWLFAAG